MIKLDNDLLSELGLDGLPPEEKKKLLAHIYETLEMRVGVKLAEQMTDAQLDEFEQFINRNDEAGALRWLETNFPHYKDVVASEFEKLKGEVKQVAPQILSAGAPAQPMGQQPLQEPSMPQPPTPQMQPQYPQPPMPPQPAAVQQPPQPMWPGDQSVEAQPQQQPQPWTPPQQPQGPTQPQYPDQGQGNNKSDYDLAG